MLLLAVSPPLAWLPRRSREAAAQDPEGGGELALLGGFGGEVERVNQGDHRLGADDEAQCFDERVDPVVLKCVAQGLERE